MNLGAIIEVAIGLIFVWIVLSLTTMQFALALFDITMTAGTESSLIQQGIFKIRDDLKKKNGLSRDHAAIDALNVLADLARSAASTEAGTAITKKTLDLLKTEANKFSGKYPVYKKHMDAALSETRKFKEERVRRSGLTC